VDRSTLSLNFKCTLSGKNLHLRNPVATAAWLRCAPNRRCGQQRAFVAPAACCALCSRGQATRIPSHAAKKTPLPRPHHNHRTNRITAAARTPALRSSLRRRLAPDPTRALFGGLFGGSKTPEDTTMGAQPSKSRGWKPSPAEGPKSKRVSKLGFDVTPLTTADREREAAQLNDMSKCVFLDACLLVWGMSGFGLLVGGRFGRLGE